MRGRKNVGVATVFRADGVVDPANLLGNPFQMDPHEILSNAPGFLSLDRIRRVYSAFIVAGREFPLRPVRPTVNYGEETTVRLLWRMRP